MAKKTNYKMPERNLDLPADLAFVNKLLKDLGLEAEPSARGVILDLAYTLARDKLVEAQRFATMANRSNVGVEDLKMAEPERNVPLERNPKASTENLEKKMAQPDQMGKKADLMTKGAEQAKPKPNIRATPSKPVVPPFTPTTSGAGPPKQRTPSCAKKPKI
ncbi:uncharacterized protein LOC119561531 [Drosophila subpulchrella]|uniref:uncharacterized protein LOC119561531 n=1 Tax=Drosophila subpulchrella TaxID=1486046 RepID=UPI0018A1A717|nr:uncharacterized protein LOC119561531 [Drosophila subpulchrella]